MIDLFGFWGTEKVSLRKLIFVHQDGGSRAQDAQEHSRRARVMDGERLMGGHCSEDSWAGGSLQAGGRARDYLEGSGEYLIRPLKEPRESAPVPKNKREKE